MSMRVLSMAQFVEIFFAYSVGTLLIPGLLLKEKLKELAAVSEGDTIVGKLKRRLNDAAKDSKAHNK